MKKIKEKIQHLEQNKKMLLIMIVGIIGIAFIAFSELAPKQESKLSTQKNTESKMEYEEKLEYELCEILSKVDGAGNTEIMITLESTAENVYAKNEKRDNRSGNENQQNSYSETYVLTRGDGGIVLKTGTPKVRGVIVVCEGADQVQVKKDVVDAVTSVLSISSNQVSVLKMKNQEETE